MYEVNKESMEQAYRDFEENWKGSHDDYKEYLYFSEFIQSLFISKCGYIITTGNFQVANYKLMWLIKRKMEKHPIIWKLFWKFFMVG